MKPARPTSVDLTAVRKTDGEYYTIDPSPDRKIMDLQREGFDSVRLLGRYRYTRAKQELPAHSHGRMLEICYMESGRQVYVVRGREYLVSGGDVFVTFPGERHGTGDHPEGRGVLYWLLVSVPQARQSLLGLPQPEARVLMRRLMKIPARQFRGRPVMPSILRALFDCHARADDPLRKSRMRELLLRLLLEVVDSAYDTHPAPHSDPIQAARRYIDANLEQCPSLSNLADAVGLSISRLKTRFKAETGISPADYIMRRRIELALELLRRGEGSVTDVAMRLGFSSSQYFATVFKRYTLHSPRQARESQRATRSANS